MIRAPTRTRAEREADALYAIIEGLELDARSSSTSGEAALRALIHRAKGRADEIVAEANYDKRIARGGLDL